MLGRRRFLGGTLAASAVASCYPSAARGPAPVGPSAAASSVPQLRAMADLPAGQHLMLGYPVNMETPPDAFFAWREELAQVGLDRFAFNNVGNPEVESHFPFNSHALEREVVARFAELYGFPSDDAWGFITNSGTDSNMHGLYMGRTLLHERAGRRPKIYFTKEAHYSIQILADLLAMDWVHVGTHDDGRMDEADLARRLAEHPGEPALVVATIGTTFKGAVDSVDDIQAALAGTESYLHLDAALFGGFLPHTSFASELFQREGRSPTGAERYDSIAVSCHKFFGFPSPAGIFVATRSAFEGFHRRFSQVHDPEYLLQVPGTITCSRDSVKPAEFLFHASPEAFERQREDAARILRNTDYLLEQLQTHFPALRATRANPMSNTIHFKCPGRTVVETYSLAAMGIERDGTRTRHAHVVVMPHARKEILDRFLEDLQQHG